MYNNSMNSQVIYSLECLSDSLIKLLKNDSVSNITITRLCNVSGISRRTFYRNCESLIDLISYKIDKLVYCLLLTDSNVNDNRVHFLNFFNYCYNHKQFLMILKKEYLFSLFIERFQLQFNNKSYLLLEQVSNKNKDIKNLKIYFNSYIVGRLSSLLECWVENDFEEPINNLIEIACSLIPNP